jgi:hypothetical protein
LEIARKPWQNPHVVDPNSFTYLVASAQEELHRSLKSQDTGHDAAGSVADSSAPSSPDSVCLSSPAQSPTTSQSSRERRRRLPTPLYSCASMSQQTSATDWPDSCGQLLDVIQDTTEIHLFFIPLVIRYFLLPAASGCSSPRSWSSRLLAYTGIGRATNKVIDVAMGG